MHWIYILQCENNYFYVGETTRLYRRFWEHLDGMGGLNTLIYSPEKIVAIYKVNIINNFMVYNEYVTDIIDGVWHENYPKLKLQDFNDEEYYCDHLFAENNIVECLMTHKKDEWNKIRGGKYTRFNIEYRYPNNKFVKDLPLCKCNLPCDIKKNENENYLYFRCAKKNIWDKLKEEFDIDDEPCNFFMKYMKDEQLKIQENIRFEERRKKLKELFTKSRWLNNVEINDCDYPHPCVGGCNRTSKSIKLTYSNKKRNLCFDCFIEKNEELKHKYDNPNKKKCSIKIDEYFL